MPSEKGGQCDFNQGNVDLKPREKTKDFGHEDNKEEVVLAPADQVHNRSGCDEKTEPRD